MTSANTTITQNHPMSQSLQGKPCATFPAKALKEGNVGNCRNVTWKICSK